MLPLAARTAGHKYILGAHVSAAGGVDKAVNNAVHIGANSFALFLKSQRKWANPPLEDSVADTFHACCGTHSYAQSKHVVPHGSYLVNLAHTDKERTEQAYGAFIDDLKRCERLGIGLYNFHPGNVQGVTRGEAIRHLAGNLNRAHKETKSVVTLLENMAAGGNVLGSTFEDLAETIELVEDKSRIGVCLDTCHAFAAGYDLRTKEALERTLEKLDKIVGLKYLRALHLNDSKAPFDSRRDLHANIGTGFLGLRAFHGVMNETRLEDLPIVLETPIEVYDDDGNPGIWAREIKMLESLHGMDLDCKEFKELEETLASRGQKERARVQDQVDRKAEKDKSKSVKKSKKKKDVATSDEDSE
ncbi:AP endonuclease [Myriangium duriaei CBS 260.36]|uniref:Apurinic-apyrimidinic endonuclease 1 n=1 Tax=Myriangium duriaei CBS 260.36 TaxID=1168546 RepID=A0A9P4IWE0_9PEZI|nr:AP endonuclease [Myriangium duriaei CBS 260.36]